MLNHLCRGSRAKQTQCSSPEKRNMYAFSNADMTYLEIWTVITHKHMRSVKPGSQWVRPHKYATAAGFSVSSTIIFLIQA